MMNSRRLNSSQTLHIHFQLICTCCKNSKHIKTHHENMRQLPEIKHAVWFETCWLLLTTSTCKQRWKSPKRSTSSRPHPQTAKHSFAVQTQMNSNYQCCSQTSWNKLILHQNHFCPKSTSIPDVLISFCIISRVLLNQNVNTIMLGPLSQLHAGT